ncbi:exodeoxyribonuclease III [Cryomorpha ignava]|uniref:Exodeoxyribonuclease III n=1 Tax=Cryomorpha ignava TaxID=101383 RepID=A0A7K3WK74_9FLAO|nr:exodeoxyribonuclease III [Cryomorpha ignava]NEN22047.1 exodeoxyribonuclease III [Cryomorpha ignava]
MKLKIISYNVNGIRAAIKKGLLEWLEAENPDIFLVQETKAKPEQIDSAAFEALGYNSYFHSAEKPGYSGVAIFSKQKADFLKAGCGIEKYDSEGRVLRADFGNLTVISTYFPSGSSGDHRQEFKMEFLNDFNTFADELIRERPKLVISGDYNICHKAIDIHNPVSNKNSSGFLPEERAWVSQFLEKGFVDSFRVSHEEPHKYTWWTYRFSARKKNLGWRIDYHLISEDLKSSLSNASILSDAFHSDHCPVLLELNI